MLPVRASDFPPFFLSRKGLVAQPGLPLREILTVGLLPSGMKLWPYCCWGWQMGRYMNIGPGSVIAGKKVRIGDEVSVGAFSILGGTELNLGGDLLKIWRAGTAAQRP